MADTNSNATPMKVVTGDGLAYYHEKVKLLVKDARGRELSQADYDALSEDEKMDGTTYYIKDAQSEGIDASSISYKDTTVEAALDNKAPSNHTHKYAGSSSVGGSANSAVKLDTSTAGSATQPVYFSDGKPVATTYTLGKSVPSDAKFTDTWRGIQDNLTSDSATESLSAKQGKALKALVDTKTSNTGTITGIKMNGVSKGTSGVVDLGTVITSHQDISGKMNASLKGTANGVAELDATGKVPAAQLPSFVDDVIEGYLYNGKFYKESAHTNVITGESGKIYVDLSSEKTYRWSGSAYVVISDTIALGETSTTAYRGDRGKTAYDHSQSTHARTDATKVEASSTNGKIKINGTETTVYTHPGSGTNPHGTTKSDVGLGNVGNFKAVSTVASQGLTDTEKSNARANIGAGTSSSDTKNTAGSTDTSSKIFLVGATSQAANPQTYSDNQVYATNGQLNGNSMRVAEAVTMQYDSTNKCLNFVFS